MMIAIYRRYIVYRVDQLIIYTRVDTLLTERILVIILIFVMHHLYHMGDYIC